MTRMLLAPMVPVSVAMTKREGVKSSIKQEPNVLSFNVEMLTVKRIRTAHVEAVVKTDFPSKRVHIQKNVCLRLWIA